MTLFTDISKPIEIGLKKFGYKEKIEEYRESIDRLDSVLIYTLGERFEKTKKIGKIKKVKVYGKSKKLLKKLLKSIS